MGGSCCLSFPLESDRQIFTRNFHESFLQNIDLNKDRHVINQIICFSYSTLYKTKNHPTGLLVAIIGSRFVHNTLYNHRQQTKTIAMILLIAIAIVEAIGMTIGTGPSSFLNGLALHLCGLIDRAPSGINFPLHL